MKIKLIKDLIGTKPLRIDRRTRNADGSLKYPEQQKTPQMTTLERVYIKREKGQDWLYWQWDRSLKETPLCNYSGIACGSKHVENYALAVYE